MGGQLAFESTPGSGSRFFFTVPLAPAQEAVPLPREENQDAFSRISTLAEGHHVNALVADDVEENRDILERLLSAIGVNVRLAEDGRLAIEGVRKEKPDIVFMDIRNARYGRI